VQHLRPRDSSLQHRAGRNPSVVRRDIYLPDPARFDPQLTTADKDETNFNKLCLAAGTHPPTHGCHHHVHTSSQPAKQTRPIPTWYNPLPFPDHITTLLISIFVRPLLRTGGGVGPCVRALVYVVWTLLHFVFRFGPYTYLTQGNTGHHPSPYCSTHVVVCDVLQVRRAAERKPTGAVAIQGRHWDGVMGVFC